LKDNVSFVVGDEHSLVRDTFRVNMLTTEGEQHDFYKRPMLPTFRLGSMRELMETAIRQHCNELVDSFVDQGQVELRSAFACRLPIKTVLSLFGLPQEDEKILRGWYDSFEQALANFDWDPDIRAAGRTNMDSLHDYLQDKIEQKRAQPDGLILDQLLSISEPRQLTDDEIKANAAIIFFGGISTVEALTLNAVHTLENNPEAKQQVLANPEQVFSALDEVVRLCGPVQSAHRHVTREVTLGGVTFQPGDSVNFMLASANRDPAVFENPDSYNPSRGELRKHVGFAIGSHNCLGSHLAKLEAATALEVLYSRCPGLQLDPAHPVKVRGFEFRQPGALHLRW